MTDAVEREAVLAVADREREKWGAIMNDHTHNAVTRSCAATAWAVASAIYYDCRALPTTPPEEGKR